MKVCGVELKANEAILTVMSLDDGLFNILDMRTRKLQVPSTCELEDIRKFQFDFAKLMEDYQVDTVVIKSRPMKGKFAGGAIGFKLEAAIQLITDLKVQLMQATEIKAIIKRNPLFIDFEDTELKGFQKDAFMIAYAYLMGINYKHVEEVEIEETGKIDVWAKHKNEQ